jgi:thiosulfate reductase cytochrome b subunit
MHWLNFPLVLIMVWSGAMIYWANRAYWPPLPDSFFKMLGLEARLAEGMAYHFVFMWIFAVNGFAYAIYLAVSGEWRELVPTLQAIREAPLVALHELKLRRLAPEIRGKFNAAQRLTYFAVFLMGAGALITGFAIHKPVQLWWLTGLVGGYELARLFHYLIAVAFMAFFLVHVAQVARAGWNKFRAMITGWEVEEKDGN